MEIGIFAKTFERDSLDGVLAAVCEANLGCVQFNMVCAVGSSLPEFIEPVTADSICQAFSRRKIKMSAVSGTCNLIHPDPEQRQAGIDRVKTLIDSCDELGTSVVSLCTGSRDADNMWRAHPDNESPQAWQHMVEAFKELLPVAEEHDVILGVEPELANVINSAQKARQLIDELGSSHVKIIMDGANLLTADQRPAMKDILSESIGLLADDIVIAHAKDIASDPAVGHVAAGEGCLDYDHYLACLKSAGFEGPLILHGLNENQVSQSVSFLESRLNQIRV